MPQPVAYDLSNVLESAGHVVEPHGDRLIIPHADLVADTNYKNAAPEGNAETPGRVKKGQAVLVGSIAGIALEEPITSNDDVIAGFSGVVAVLVRGRDEAGDAPLSKYDTVYFDAGAGANNAGEVTGDGVSAGNVAIGTALADVASGEAVNLTPVLLHKATTVI